MVERKGLVYVVSRMRKIVIISRESVLFGNINFPTVRRYQSSLIAICFLFESRRNATVQIIIHGNQDLFPKDTPTRAENGDFICHRSSHFSARRNRKQRRTLYTHETAFQNSFIILKASPIKLHGFGQL